MIKQLLRLWAAPGPWAPGEAAEDGLTRVALPLVDAFAARMAELNAQWTIVRESLVAGAVAEEREQKLAVVEARVAEMEEALRERVEMACQKTCGWARRIVGGAIEQTPIHSAECTRARAAMRAAPGRSGDT